MTGAERTTFYPVVEATAKEFRLAIRPDARPEAGHFYRSDHFSLARVGIPSFSINEGMKYKGHAEAWGLDQEREYVEKHYHHPVTNTIRRWTSSETRLWRGLDLRWGGKPRVCRR